MQNLGGTHTKNSSNVYQKFTFKRTSVFYLARIFVVKCPSSIPLLLDYNPNLKTHLPSSHFHRWGWGVVCEEVSPVFMPSNEMKQMKIKFDGNTILLMPVQVRRPERGTHALIPGAFTAKPGKRNSQ